MTTYSRLESLRESQDADVVKPHQSAVVAGDRCCNLRLARRLWASRMGLAPPPDVTLDEWLAVAQMLEHRRRGP